MKERIQAFLRRFSFRTGGDNTCNVHTVLCDLVRTDGSANKCGG